MDKLFELTPAQLAIAQARREKKKQAEALQANIKPIATALLQRQWLNVSQPPKSLTSSAKILTWNILAQCLVRRTLFPTSDCLKSVQRHSLIQEELRRQNAQIICLQEVDQLEKLSPMLEKSGYKVHYASGRGKKHGCLIGYKKELYTFVSEKIVYYDEQHIGTTPDQDRIGASFKTKNIGYMVAIKSKTNENEGIIAATTHLFWHPKYTYERIRQAAILLQEVAAFKESLSATSWPCIVAGGELYILLSTSRRYLQYYHITDFNFGPADPGYSLLTGDTLLPSQEDDIKPSMVVHLSMDPTVTKNAPPTEEIKEDDEGNAVDPDRVITGARVAVDSDGLLSTQELVDWFSALPNVRSVYADGLQEARELGNKVARYGDRVAIPDERHGVHEPQYTSYTHYWQAVLDYIFILEPPQKPVHIAGLLAPLTEEDMIPGLPQKRISGSDHTCLVAELEW